MPEDYYNNQPPMASSSIKTLPSNNDAECSILSAMLLSEDILNSVLLELDEDDFFYENNRIIFTTMRDMYEDQIQVDALSLADKLKSSGNLDRVGGMGAIARLGEDTFSLSNWKHHAEMLHRDATLRLMIQAAAKIANIASDAPEDTQEVVDSAEKLLMDVTNRDVHDKYQTIEEAVSTLYEDLAEMSKQGVHSQGVKTGFPTMDKMFLGLRAGQMVVVGARPGVGKTSFALNLAVQAATNGAQVAFFSLEMTCEEIAQRLVSAYSGVPLQDIRSANIQASQWNSLLDATNELSNLDIMIDDTPGTTITEVRAKARRMLRDKPNGLVILDYLQIVTAAKGSLSDSRASQVSEMSRGIKIMAKDLGIPVIALSQLSRKNEERTGKRAKRPQLSDLRESGSIEQDADIVVLLDRSMTPEEAERDDRPDLDTTEFIVAKNRSGPTGIIKMIFMPEQTKFREVDFQHAEE